MKKVIVIGLFLILFLILWGGIYFLFFNKGVVSICNDGTTSNECSKIKPYFCSNGILIEKASSCGCSNISKIDTDKCVSDFQKEAKEITLDYILRGKTGEINFTVYKNLSDYLSEIPRYMDSSQNPTLLDFKLRVLNEEQQRELLLPLVVKIESLTKDKTDQARIAISIVQNIPFGNSSKTTQIGSTRVEYQRYPYEVLYDMKGVCSEKSELMIFLLREIGYGTASLYYNIENHEAVGIKCQRERNKPSEFCFVETTGPSILTDDRTEYFGTARQLNSSPKITPISDGISFGTNLYEYKDAKILIGVRESMKEYGTVNFLQHFQFRNLKQKYGLVDFSEYTF